MQRHLQIGIFVIVSTSCDYTEYTTEVGEYVAYHWDAEALASEGEYLCGGTIAAADRWIAVIADHYGWPLPNGGPRIEYFWDPVLTKSTCSAQACMYVSAGGSQLFSYHPFDTHELAHTTKGGHLASRFIEEAFAMRWQSGVIGQEFAPQTVANFLSEDQLRAQLELYGSLADIAETNAFTWWVGLESTYGSAKMAAFVTELDHASARDVERALRGAFGISLAESIELANNLPPSYVDDPACELPDLPTFIWTDEPLVIDRGFAQCSDDDLISILGHRVSWVVALEFPVALVAVDVRVSVESGELSQKSVAIAKCDGELSSDSQPYDRLPARNSDSPSIVRHFAGRHVASIVGELGIDGRVEFPRLELEPSQP